MKTPNNKKQNNGGILSAIAALFKGGAAAGGASGAAVTSGIFATKAGMLGLLLGGATIAAGAGAVYHLAGGSSAANTAYSPELFQNSYYEEQAALAEAERNQNNDIRSSAVNSTIDMFSASARQSGYFDSGSAASAGTAADMPNGSDSISAEASSAAESSAAAPASAAAGDSGTSQTSAPANKLASSKGFSASFGGGSSSAASAPRMKSMGGLSGGIGGKFASMKNLSAGGKTTAMASNAGKRHSSGRSAAKANKGSKKAFSQAKFANFKGKQAIGSASMETARTEASSAFTGEASGGDEGSSVEGVGMDTTGMAVGTSLKNGTPNGNSNLKSVPPVSESEDASPWKDLVKKAGIMALVAAGLYAVGMLIAKKAKMAAPAWKAGYQIALKFLAIAIAAIGIMLIGAAVQLATKYNQKMYGIIYGLSGAFLLWKAYSLFDEANGMDTSEGCKEREDAINKDYNEAKSKLDEKYADKLKNNPNDKNLLDAKQKELNSINDEFGVKNGKIDYNHYKASGFGLKASGGTTTANTGFSLENMGNNMGSGMLMEGAKNGLGVEGGSSSSSGSSTAKK